MQYSYRLDNEPIYKEIGISDNICDLHLLDNEH